VSAVFCNPIVETSTPKRVSPCLSLDLDAAASRRHCLGLQS
jgi:hypothetical protein